MQFYAYSGDNLIDEWLVFSVGGGSLKEFNEKRTTFNEMIYPHQKMNEILDYTKKFNLSFVDYILKYEGESIIPYLYSILEQMKKTKIGRASCRERV